MAQAAPTDRVRDLLLPAVDQLGLHLVDVSWHQGRGRAILRLTVDRPGGVTIEECGRASEAASAVLDLRDEILPGPYSLEVSSPGAERDLASEEDYQRALGRRVRITLRDGESQTVVEGRLVSLGSDELDLEVIRPKSGRLRSWRVSRKAVAGARVVVDL